MASAQGQCKGRSAEHTPACDTTPAKAPFAPTGWKTVALDHFTMQTVDYKKEAGYYAALMNWKVRSDDGQQAVLDIGDDVGTVVIRGGYVAPPPPPPRVPTAADSAAGRGGRGGGRGGAARAGERGVGFLRLANLAVEREDDRSGAEEARARSRCRQRRQGVRKLSREGSGRLRRAAHQRRLRQGSARRGSPMPRYPSRSRSSTRTGRPCGSITSPSA